MDVPSLLRLPSGCAFHPRCPVYISGRCEQEVPELLVTEGECSVACHLEHTKMIR
jgi:peptide/nickel transport system ATP-binding protein